MDIGKCPKCENFVTSNDIKEVKFRGTFQVHHAYVCELCGHIIGFSSSRP